MEGTLRLTWAGESPEPLLNREWLVANGLGGFACGTLAGVATRRYHGLLTAALPTPLGRYVMFNHLTEMLRPTKGVADPPALHPDVAGPPAATGDGPAVIFGGEEYAGGKLQLSGIEHLKEFRLEWGLPVWRYAFHGLVWEKQVVMPYRQNTVYVRYRLLEGGQVRLKLSPAVHFRPYDSNVNDPGHRGPYTLTAQEERFELSNGPDLPPLRMQIRGQRTAFTFDPRQLQHMLYRMEETRGYEAVGDLWSPGYFRADLAVGQDVTLLASTEAWETMLVLTPDQALNAEVERSSRLLAAAHPAVRRGPASFLVLAGDQFIITPAGRIEDAVRARAAGEEIRTVIAGYHWFTDWGRDTMISLEGLTLTTGRQVEAGYILRTFAHYVRDGLIPNYFPDGQKQGVYHTADATLWFFHSLNRYVEVTNDTLTLRQLLPVLHDIVDHHLRGTRFGIGVDPHDGLLRQGQEGYQLTWMDAKVGDWVVTPRRGKAVEINALWYNALKLLEGWTRTDQGDAAAAPLAEHAERARRSFNARFWNAAAGYLYDVVDSWGVGDDASCRPNQLLAFSLPHPILEREHWKPVLDVVTDRLLTPVGLRSLAPGSPDFKARYDGDLRARDAAYHQGTVWAWLIGPYVDAWLKVHPEDRSGARRFLHGFVDHLHDACVGSISEVFDAEPPFTPRGCVAQAWSVAEVLRCWALTEG